MINLDHIYLWVQEKHTTKIDVTLTNRYQTLGKLFDAEWYKKEMR